MFYTVCKCTCILSKSLFQKANDLLPVWQSTKPKYTGIKNIHSLTEFWAIFVSSEPDRKSAH